jgi:tetratricopeptide (TPR) repeat protein
MATGDVLAQKGAAAAAFGCYREALEIRRALAAADPDNTGLRCDVASSLTAIAGVLAEDGDRAGALAASREARELVGELCAREPARAEWHDDLAALDDRIGELAKPA